LKQIKLHLKKLALSILKLFKNKMVIFRFTVSADDKKYIMTNTKNLYTDIREESSCN